MMIEPLENEYFNWLCAKVLDVEVPVYYDLMRILHQTEFTWTVYMDHNRAADGVELRDDFLRRSRWQPDQHWLNEGCSVLEMLIALAKTASFQIDMPIRNCFWMFMQNLGLEDYRRVSRSDVPTIERILRTLIWRTYEPNGHGGMFPLRQPREDQRQVEIWYQFCAYVEENELV